MPNTIGLQTLTLGRNNITVAGLKELKELKSLLSVTLNSTQIKITDAGLNELIRAALPGSIITKEERPQPQ